MLIVNYRVLKRYQYKNKYRLIENSFFTILQNENN